LETLLRTSPTSFRPAVVIPAYRRAEALSKLLRSVNEAEYPEEGCTLIISLEGGVDEVVVQVAEEFQFNHGEKEIVRHSEKLGLKSHIYTSAGYSQEFGSVIVLEDDLIVSPAYYFYAVRALQAYEHAESIAGIALYAQRFNETAQLPFEPMPSYYAGYFMMLACSWGQAWTAGQWSSYQKWREESSVPLQINDHRIPQNIRNWPGESWKREFNYYLAETERTIFYPYKSVSTNSSHYGGENMSGTGSLFEVPLVCLPHGIDSLTFPESDEALISYDMYMEANGSYVEKMTGFENNKITFDLYGTKPVEMLQKKHWVFTSKETGNPKRTYDLKRIPIEWNLKDPLNDFSNHAFFSLAQSAKAAGFTKKRWAYIQLAIHLGANRLDASRFILNNFIFHLKKRLGI
jgi:glycosyltransferase involved in cell wall biosynthesis